jgi:hypothetical protein
MKQAKSNREIYQEYFNRKPIDIPLSEEAKKYIEEHLAQLIAALQTGRASPGAQHEGAGLIEALTSRKRGRPRQLKTDFTGLAWFVDYQEGLHKAQGHRSPHAAALVDLREAKKGEGAPPSDQTLREYYRKGVTQSREGDRRFARQIDRDAERVSADSIADAIDAALAIDAGGDPAQLHVNHLRYARGTVRRIIRAENK